MTFSESGLPDDVKRLIEIDRDFAEIPTRARTRVAQRLAIPIVVPVRVPTATVTEHVVRSTWKALVAKGALVVALGGGAAGVAHHLLSPKPSAQSVNVSAATVRPPVEAPAIVEQPMVTASASVVIAVRSSAPIVKNDAASIEAEHRVLDEAHAAIVRGEPDRALVATAEHAKRFPHGTLTEEREAIEIRALSQLGRKAEARAALEKLRAGFPHSFLLEGAAQDVDSAQAIP